MSFPRHWTRTDSAADGSALEYQHNVSSLRLKLCSGKKPWRIVNRRGMFARSLRGRVLAYSSPDSAAKRAEHIDSLPTNGE